MPDTVLDTKNASGGKQKKQKISAHVDLTFSWGDRQETSKTSEREAMLSAKEEIRGPRRAGAEVGTPLPQL